MKTPEIHVEELKKDPEFLANIERLKKEYQEEESITKGYQLLDAQLIIEVKDDEVNETFTFIVNTAFDRLADRLTTTQSFDMSNTEDIATTRAIYEHGIQRYSEDDTKGAKEIFLVLNHTINNEELQDAMMIHACAVMAGHTFDDFIKNLVDIEGVDENDPLAFFVQTFVQPVDILLTMFAKQVQQGQEELQVLKEAK